MEFLLFHGKRTPEGVTEYTWYVEGAVLVEKSIAESVENSILESTA